MSSEPEDLAQAYKEVFETDLGKKVLEDLAQFTKFQTPSFDEAEDTSLGQMAFREGQRSVVARICSLLEVSRPEFQKRVRQATYEMEV